MVPTDFLFSLLTAEDLEDSVRRIMRSEGNLFGWIADSGSFCDALASAPPLKE